MKLPDALRALGRSLLVMISICLLVGPLALLQMGAWAWMLTNYAQEDSFEQAVQDTFSGERPCHLCTFIKEAKGDAPQTPAGIQQTEAKDFKLIPGPACLHSMAHLPIFIGKTAFDTRLNTIACRSVPKPPPRRFV